MLPDLDTGRLTLRLARPGMHQALARFLADNFPGHLDRWSPPPAPGYFTEAFWSERLAIAVEEYRADRAVRFVLQARGAPLAGEVLGTFQACHLGYQIGRAHEGRGLMAEALGAANRFMFETQRVHRIMANFRPENARSRRLLERLGFVEEGLARDYLYIDGAWRDHVLTSLHHPGYRDEWLLPRPA
jgi:ribosomal-protein-alanine N-acetyltransferase